MDEKIVDFLRKKDYRLIRNIGRGGTAITVLLKDELIDKEYVCKKYLLLKGIDPKEYFNNFLTEIKLLHEISHPNIVRVYNYYLYPERYTGYLLMEHIDGETISNFISKNPEKINSIKETYRYFADSVSGIITKIENKSTYNNFEYIIQGLEKVYQKNMLESTNPAAERSGYGCFGKVFDSGYIPLVPPQGAGVCTLRKQSNVKNLASVIRVFLNGTYYYKKNNTMSLWVLRDFIDLLKTCSNEKLRVITMNIYNRFDSIERYEKYDIPF